MDATATTSQKAMVAAPVKEIVKRDPSALPHAVLDRVLKSTDAVRKPIMGHTENAMSKAVQNMWERADEMMFKQRGDKDMTDTEVTKHLDSQPNPFEPLPEDHDARLAEAIEKGDLEALTNMENVYVYQTYRDQKKAQQGEEYDDNALEEGQVAMTAKAIWNHFETLHKLRGQITDEGEWGKVLETPKWAKFIRWYPTIAGMAATSDIAEHDVDSLRHMLEQKHMLETDNGYTRTMADAAYDVYSHGPYVEACKKAQKQESTSAN